MDLNLSHFPDYTVHYLHLIDRTRCSGVAYNVSDTATDDHRNDVGRFIDTNVSETTGLYNVDLITLGRGTIYCHCLHSKVINGWLKPEIFLSGRSSNLKLCLDSIMLIHLKIIPSHIPEDSDLCSHTCRSLKSHMYF
jgi:hypothetical protein